MSSESFQKAPAWASPQVPRPSASPPDVSCWPPRRRTRDGAAEWPAKIAAVYRRAGLWVDRTIPDQLREVAAGRPAAIALVDGATRLSYRDLVAYCDRVGEGLLGLGLVPGDRVVVQLPNRWEHVVATLGCLSAGVVPVWSLPDHGQAELTGLVRATDAVAVIGADSHRGVDLERLAWSVADASPHLRHVIVVGGPRRHRSLSFDELATGPAPAGPLPDSRAADDVAILIPSGGTTGMSKIAPRTHNDLTYMARQAAEVCAFDASTVYLAVLPLGHGFPNTGPGVLGTLLRGGRVVLCHSPAPEQAFAVMTREAVTATSLVPAIAHRWLEYVRTGQPAPPSLDLVQVGAARLDPGTAREIESRLGARLQQVYGMAEGLLCLTRLGDGERVYTTQGRPISPWDEVQILTEDGRPAEPGTVGSVVTRGPYTIRGYFYADELNSEAFTSDGWYRTGDLASMTPDGDIVMAGREKDVINRGGEKISAGEIEEMCRALGLGDCAAVARPHPELGEDVCLFVTPSDADLTVAELDGQLRRNGLAAFKTPASVLVVEAIPRTPMGKIDKGALRRVAARPLDLSA